jgi:GNAT superfamily N-acetyltransferase
MLPSDVDAATEMILAHEWGVRREWLQLATTLPACIPLVADADGAIVATGVATASGAAGWIGTIFVARAWRGQGLGRAITQAIIDRLESGGCRSLVLVATADGRRLYERMGFEVATRYRILEAPGLSEVPRAEAIASDRPAAGSGPSAPPMPHVVRPFTDADLEAVLALDLAGTGEDRSPVIRRLLTPETARVAIDARDGTLAGFVIRAPWGGGATVARSMDAALAIVGARRAAAGPAGRVRVGLLAENEPGLERLRELGFVDQWSAPRMVRGEPLDWHPDWIWGQFNHAMG